MLKLSGSTKHLEVVKNGTFIVELSFIFLPGLSLQSIKSNIWQVHWLDLVSINQHVKNYQNISHSSRFIAIFIFSHFCLSLASVNENSHLQIHWLDLVGNY